MKGSKRHYFPIILVVGIVTIGSLVCHYQLKQKSEVMLVDSKAGMPYITNIIQATQDNTYFRKVLFTGASSQLVAMDIPPGGEVGEETHLYTEQTLFFLSGTGKAILDRKESPISAGDVVVVTPGTKHNFINTGTTSFKIYTVYSPPNHIDGRIHVTKADADKDVDDESFGEKAK